MAEAAEQQTAEHRLGRLRDALDSGRLVPVRRILKSLHPAEIARLLESLPHAERKVVWGVVDVDDQGEVLLHVNDEVRAALIQGMEPEDIIAAARDLDIDDLADFVDDLPETLTEQVLRSMDLANRQALEKVMSYAPDTAGGLTNTDTVTIRPDVTLDVVMRYLRLRGSLPDHTDVIYVVDRYGRFIGGLSLERLLMHDPSERVAEAMDTELEPLSDDLPAREVAHQFENHDLISAPVVDAHRLLIGRITIDDVVDVIRDEAEHNLMSMAGLDEEEDIFAPVASSARRRAVWLGINLLTALLAAQVVGLFEHVIDQVVALAVLMPVVASMGGISGSQTLTLMIRGLALGQIGSGNTRSLLRKEMAVAAINGILWALVVAGIVLVWFRNPTLGAVIALAMIVNQLFAALSGFGIPLILRKLDIDPALAGSVVLTTITDVVGFFAFLGLGALVLL
ncbi:magnesium transporter [uncultured Abyssibacter sp.]|uniref:magnesium transporter n=1 Tax=uncultured Abyssibacter sp. TaxID=2320202 RepID=UPI0032B24DA1